MRGGADESALAAWALDPSHQRTFCGAATTIIAGAAAERLRFVAYLVVALLVSGLIDPVFGHWAWGGLIEGEPTGCRFDVLV